jgi:hypothetical protein
VPLTGSLDATPLESVLRLVANQRASGTLLIIGPEFEKRLVLRDGLLAGCASTNPAEFLGTYLVGWGYVGATELDETIAMQREHGVMLGDLLVTIGLVSEAQLAEVLTTVAEEVVLDAFLWSSGTYRLQAGAGFSGRFRPLDLPLGPLIDEGVRRRLDVVKIRHLAPSIHHRPKLLGSGHLRALPEAERVILTSFDGAHSVAEVALAHRARTFAVWELAARAIGRGYARVLPPATVSDEEDGESFGSVRTLVLSAEQSIANGRLARAWSTIELLARRFRAASDIDVIVGVLRQRLNEAVRAALPDPAAKLAVGTLDEAILAVPANHPERQLVTAINRPTAAADLVRRLPGEATRNWCLVVDLVDRGVLEVLGAGGNR